MTAAIINYCSNDYRFIGKCIEEAKVFAKQVIVPVCDHFFDGTPENRLILEQTYAEHPDCTFLEFAYSVKQLYTPYVRRSPEDEDWVCLWHSTARYISYFYLEPEIENLFFLDADEIVEGEKMAAWLEKEKDECFTALWFFAYQYGLKATERTASYQQTALLVKREALGPLQILTSLERFGLFASLPGTKRLQIVGLDGHPMIHHYSWVRSLEESRKKSRTWGKRSLCDWEEWIQTAFQNEKLETVEPYFDPLSIAIPKTKGASPLFSNVIYVNDRSLSLRGLDAVL